jgi:hypothetical protein
MCRRINLLIAFILLICFNLNAQIELYKEAESDSSTHKNVTLKGFIDTYFGINSQGKGNIPFMVNSNRSNQVSINIALLEFGFSSDQFRAKITPAFGSYMNENYSNVDGTLRYFYEANTGIKLLKKKELWLDAGVFSSPISNENPLSKDHICYTRALGSEFVPYYLTGARLSYGLNSKTTLYASYFNGWQEINNSNKAPAFALQVDYKPNAKNLITVDIYAGDERDNNPNYRNRYFFDAYWIYNMEGKFSVTSCANFGIQETVNQTSNKSLWGQTNVSLRYSIAKKWSANFRTEYFYDADEVVLFNQIKTGNESLYSTTLGLCYKASDNAFLRIEGRHYTSNRSIYSINNEARSQLFWGVVSLSAWF